MNIEDKIKSMDNTLIRLAWSILLDKPLDPYKPSMREELLDFIKNNPDNSTVKELFNEGKLHENIINKYVENSSSTLNLLESRMRLTDPTTQQYKLLCEAHDVIKSSNKKLKKFCDNYEEIKIIKSELTVKEAEMSSLYEKLTSLL